MKPKRLVIVAVAVSFALVTSACTQAADGGNEATGKNLTVAEPLDFTDLSPDGSFLRSTDSQIVTLVADSLYRINKDDHIEPAIADAMPTISADQLNWTIKLRPDVTFSNHTPLTSADVKFSLDNAKKGVQQGKLFKAIESIATPDSHTVVIHTRSKNATLLWALTNYPGAILPKNFGGKSESEFYQKPIGAGPFIIDERKPGTDLKLVRNATYYGTKAKLDSIIFVAVTDPNARVLRLRSGEVDLVDDPPLQQVSQLKSNSSFQVVSRPVGVMRLGLNTAKPPLDDLHVRRAISLALDRDSIVKAALRGGGSKACSWVSATFLRGYQPQFGCTTELVQAKTELAQSAYPNGTSFSLVYDSADSLMPLTAQIVQSDLAKIGISVNLNGTTNQLYKAALTNKSFQGRFSLFALPGDPGLSINNYIATTAEGTSSKLVPHITEEYQQSLATFDEAARFKIYDNVMNEIAENSDAVGLYSPNKLWASSSKVVGASILPTNKLNFADIDLAP